jgi:hypothetical protein
MAHEVFISYSDKDRTIADAICSMLENSSIKCWYAPRDIRPGANYGGEIVRAIRATNIFVLVFSKHSNLSKPVLKEIERAYNKEIVIIPFKIQDSPLSDDMEFYISDTHWLDALTPPLESNIEKLIITIKSVLGINDNSKGVKKIEEENQDKSKISIRDDLDLVENKVDFDKNNIVNKDDFNCQTKKLDSIKIQRRAISRNIKKKIVLENKFKSLPINKFQDEQIAQWLFDYLSKHGFKDRVYWNLIHAFNTKKSGLPLLVFDDKDINYRNNPKSWEKLLYEKKIYRQQAYKERCSVDPIVLKTSYPFAQGKIFQILTRDFEYHLIIITSIDEIRKEDVMISSGLSWEQTALDLVYELKHNKTLIKLLKSKYLIVNFQSEGALYLEMKEGEIWKCRLIFDPKFLEGEWSNDKGFYGSIVGTMTCFTAAIVYGLLNKHKNIETTITRALSSIRKFSINAYEWDSEKSNFSIKSVVDEIIEPSSIFASAFVPIPDIEYDGGEKNDCGKEKDRISFKELNWTILEGNYRVSQNPEPLYDIGFRVALFGKRELANTPFLQLNWLITYNRREIEALRNLINLIKNYNEDEEDETPLSLAVFAPPGSGKSFVVKQLSKALELPLLEFNLSQFTVIHELVFAFRQVRNKTLEGSIPIVFWKDFDSQDYIWLQYLLSVMESGQFQDGQIIQSIGKCIFIFASETSITFETFGIPNLEYSDPKDTLYEKKKDEYEFNQKQINDFNIKKGPDFRSRLSGYLNVSGFNQIECSDVSGKMHKDKDRNTIYNKDDIFFPIKRALYIRTVFGVRDNQILNANLGLLNALIKTKQYKQGSKSLHKVLNYLISKNANKLQRSNLPWFNVLSMLVDYKEFSSLLKEDKTYDYFAALIAPEIHNSWKKLGDDQGWKLEYHKDYNYLPAQLKEENIAAARRIPEILLIEKLLIIPEKEKEFYTDYDFDKIRKSASKLEKLAIMEHEGWVDTKVNMMKWQFDEARNDDRKLHNCIIDWNETKTNDKGEKITLSNKDKNKDKDTIINYPDVLKAAGFVIVEKK